MAFHQNPIMQAFQARLPQGVDASASLSSLLGGVGPSLLGGGTGPELQDIGGTEGGKFVKFGVDKKKATKLIGSKLGFGGGSEVQGPPTSEGIGPGGEEEGLIKQLAGLFGFGG